MRSTRWIAPALSLAMAASASVAVAQPYGRPEPAVFSYGQEGWDAPPQEFRDAMRRGFHDGVEGARKDYENHRQPDVRNRDEYRDPHFMAPPDRHDYREGFRRGYAVAVRHMYGDRGFFHPHDRD